LVAGNYPNNVIGFHTNFVLGGPAPGTDPNDGVTDDERALRAERVEAFAEGSAYQEIQGTKPQSLGVGLNDSPAGLAAWIVEKFHGWSDNGGHVEDAFTKDQLLANITLYWVTGSITSSARIYYEFRHAPSRRPVSYVSVPTAGAIFPKEIYFTPRAWAEARYNIVRWTVMPSGGHFAALEEPGRAPREAIKTPGCDPVVGATPLHRPGAVGTRNPSPCEGLLIIRARSPGVL
jgi:microsomal epoxide hydrolase